jgi:hypothetical protein
MIDPTDSVTHTLPVTIPCPTRINYKSSTTLYSAVLAADLFGQWTVTRTWGGKENLRDGGKVEFAESFEAGLALLQAIAKKWEKLGYQAI